MRHHFEVYQSDGSKDVSLAYDKVHNEDDEGIHYSPSQCVWMDLNEFEGTADIVGIE